MFSLLVGSDESPSKVTFGGYDLQKYAKSDIHWHNLKSDFYWTVDLKSAYLGD